MLQIAARLTALAAACKALEAACSGKGAEGKVLKALAKLEKVENPILSSAAAACSVPASLPVPPAVEAAQGNTPAGPSQDGPSEKAAGVPTGETIGDALKASSAEHTKLYDSPEMYFMHSSLELYLEWSL